MPRHRGPAPQPVELKRLLGTAPKASNVVALTPVAGAPLSPPAGSGADLIVRLLDTQASRWIAEPDRLVLLQLLADGWDRRRDLMATLAGRGSRSYESNSKVNGTQYHDWPEVRQLERVEKDITTWLSLLGLDPTDRGRLGLAEVKARSALEDLADKRRRLMGGSPPAPSSPSSSRPSAVSRKVSGQAAG